ncbi:cytochrome c biogenesis protein CcdA [Candidatus Pacearchaeota archaeon]|nr:cytochrome c biogenesis protein CcdA [Candidatus Pacearchaeota archaeon]
MGNINFVLAFIAGVISFISPCILPVIPSYLSFIGGVSYDELADRKTSKWGILIKTLFFIAGFSIVFTTFGVVFSSVGASLSGASRIVDMVAGSIVIILGLNFIFDFIKILNMEKKFHYKKSPRGVVGSTLLGMAFAAGWTPCIGSILASILFLAGTSGQGIRGAAFLAVYSAGLGIPFIFAGLYFSSFQKRLEKIRKHLHTIKIVSGAFLVIIGILIFFGNLSQINIYFFGLAGSLETWGENNPAAPRLLFFSIFLIISLVLIYFYIRRINRLIIGNSLAVKSFILPARLIFIAFFISTTVLTISGRLDISKLIVRWLTFQGI